MKKRRANNAAKILFSWRKAMPFYYAIAIGIVILIVVIK